MGTTGISTVRKKLADSVREYTRSQVETWRLVPHLTIEAQGRGGWSDAFYLAVYGLWQVDGGEGCYSLQVDCGNGELLWGLRPVTDAEAITASLRLEDLDAKKVVTYLQGQLSEDYSGHKSSKEIEARKRSECKLYGIETYYQRKKPLPSDWRDIDKVMRVT